MCLDHLDLSHLAVECVRHDRAEHSRTEGWGFESRYGYGPLRLSVSDKIAQSTPARSVSGKKAGGSDLTAVTDP